MIFFFFLKSNQALDGCLKILVEGVNLNAKFVCKLFFDI